MADGVGTGRHGRVLVPAVGIVVIALAGLGPGCAGPVPRPAGSGTTVAGALRSRPLALVELRARPALGFDLRAQPVLDPLILDPDDLRGPCGGNYALPLASGTRQVFRSTRALVVEARAAAADGGGAVDRVAAGIRPGCAGPPGQIPVTVQSAALPAVGERRVGWVERRIPVSGGAGGPAVQLTFVAVVAGGGQLGLLFVQALEPFDYAEFAALVEMAFQPH